MCTLLKPPPADHRTHTHTNTHSSKNLQSTPRYPILSEWTTGEVPFSLLSSLHLCFYSGQSLVSLPFFLSFIYSICFVPTAATAAAAAAATAAWRDKEKIYSICRLFFLLIGLEAS